MLCCNRQPSSLVRINRTGSSGETQPCTLTHCVSTCSTPTATKDFSLISIEGGNDISLSKSSQYIFSLCIYVRIRFISQICVDNPACYGLTVGNINIQCTVRSVHLNPRGGNNTHDVLILLNRNMKLTSPVSSHLS